MVRASGPREADMEPIDDYQVETGIGPEPRSASHHVLAVLNAFLLIILAALSLALFWVVATMLGLI